MIYADFDSELIFFLSATLLSYLHLYWQNSKILSGYITNEWYGLPFYSCNSILFLYGLRLIHVPRSSILAYILALIAYIYVFNVQRKLTINFIDLYGSRYK